jgi:deoxyribodipyrimidine photo-lyase
MRRALEKKLALPAGLHPERVQWLYDGRATGTATATATATAAAPPKYLLYWMQTSVRTKYNYALEFAVAAASALALPLHVVYLLADRSAVPHTTRKLPAVRRDENALVLATERHAKFALEGLADATQRLAARGLRLEVLGCPGSSGDATAPNIPSRSELVTALARDAALVVTDCAYLRPWRLQTQALATHAKAADAAFGLVQVEGDVVVPSAVASVKEEYAARTIRPRITKHLDRFLVPLESAELVDAARTVASGQTLQSLVEKLIRPDTEASPVKKTGKTAKQKPSSSPTSVTGSPTPTAHATAASSALLSSLKPLDVSTPESVTQTLQTLDVDRSVPGVSTVVGGEQRAVALAKDFLTNKLDKYAKDRNEPSGNACSGLSLYLRFGHISPVRVAVAANKLASSSIKESRASFLEEMIVRRELSINMVVYNAQHYDSIECLPAFARETLRIHANDKRPVLYSLEQLERAQTADPYWNAAQLELLATGDMHGYMRMYWGKKLLEWTKSPEEGFTWALHLNNKLALDAPDPNSYTGIAWTFGKHDQGWAERPVFGKVRYMNEAGLKRKFRMDAYVRKAREAAKRAEVAVPDDEAAASGGIKAYLTAATKRKSSKATGEEEEEDKPKKAKTKAASSKKRRT